MDAARLERAITTKRVLRPPKYTDSLSLFERIMLLLTNRRPKPKEATSCPKSSRG